MKRYILLLLALSLSAGLFANDPKTFFLGMGGGYTNHHNLHGEIYLGKDMSFTDSMPATLRGGLAHQPYLFDYSGVKDLEASSYGLFADLSVFPFNNGFFVGLRWEAFTFNWMTDQSIDRLEMGLGYSITQGYSGTNGFALLGYRFNLSPSLRLNLTAQPGIQQYTFSSQLGGDSSVPYLPDRQTHFLMQFNVTIELLIK